MFDISNYESDKRPLPLGKNKKVISLFRDELGGKIMKEFVAFRAKTYLMDDDSEHKKSKRNKEVCNRKEDLCLRTIKPY